MSSARNAAAAYKQQDIRSESPLALVASVYELVSSEIGKARAALAARDWATKGRAVHVAGRGLSLLQCSLNVEEGGDVAHNLDRVYAYLLVRLSAAHLANDDSIFAEIADHVKELGSAWRAAARGHDSSRRDATDADRRAEPIGVGG